MNKTPTLNYLTKLENMGEEHVRQVLTVDEFVDIYYKQVHASARYDNNKTFEWGIFYLSNVGHGYPVRVPGENLTVTYNLPSYFTGFVNQHKEVILLKYTEKCLDVGIPRAVADNTVGYTPKEDEE